MMHTFILLKKCSKGKENFLLCLCRSMDNKKGAAERLLRWSSKYFVFDEGAFHTALCAA